MDYATRGGAKRWGNRVVPSPPYLPFPSTSVESISAILSGKGQSRSPEPLRVSAEGTPVRKSALLLLTGRWCACRCLTRSKPRTSARVWPQNLRAHYLSPFFDDSSRNSLIEAWGMDVTNGQPPRGYQVVLAWEDGRLKRVRSKAEAQRFLPAATTLDRRAPEARRDGGSRRTGRWEAPRDAGRIRVPGSIVAHMGAICLGRSRLR